MAVIKIKTIRKSLDKVINYAKDGNKTDNGILVEGVNCLSDYPYRDMMKVKVNFNKISGVLGYHIIQSFVGNEVTPQIANRIGVQLTKEMFGDNFQAIVCTHTNKENIHNHIVVNSVSFKNGLKFHNGNAQIALIRDISDKLCEECNISVLDTLHSKKEKAIRNARINNYVRSDTKMQMIRNDIDTAIANSKSYKQFKFNLMARGYNFVKSNTYTVVKTPYLSRRVRLERAFGGSYSSYAISEKIKNQKFETYSDDKSDTKKYYKKFNGHRKFKTVKINKSIRKSPFYHFYMAFLILIGEIKPHSKTPAQKNNILYSKELQKEVNQMNEYSKQAELMSKFALYYLDKAKDFVKTNKKELYKLRAKREDLWRKFNRATDKVEQTKIMREIDGIADTIKNKISTIKIASDLIKRSEKAISDEKEKQQIEENKRQLEIQDNKKKMRY